MDSLKPYRHYLVILLILALAKFVWVPQWQEKNDSWLRLTTIEQNLTRVEHLLSREQEISQKRDSLSEQLEKVEQQLQRTDNLVRYRLQQQKKVEESAERAGLSVEQMSWRDGIIQQDTHSQALDIRLSGELKGYIEFLSTLRKEGLSHFRLSRSNVSVRGQSPQTPGTINASLSLQVLVQVGGNNDAD